MPGSSWDQKDSSSSSSCGFAVQPGGGDSDSEKDRDCGSVCFYYFLPVEFVVSYLFAGYYYGMLGWRRKRDAISSV